MTYRAISIYSKETGLFLGRTVSGTGLTDELLDRHVNDGEARIDGKHDHLSRKVDLATGQVVDHQPPAPSIDHEWNGATKRWQLSVAAQASANEKATTRARHAQLITAQHDDIRRAVLGDKDAVRRLIAIEDEISGLKL